ncbi:MAG: hypothetical protein HOD10_09035 [Candidatus Marinimicrobia bacterium]|jgi:hypothetical protein|nr:hypothetical protein [Candidatus Neomarinimicrobiota bacterium]MBT4372921.1 hypothetical protein [Candidatus Neomarinimicrobiota bacterium]MBT5761006.1 hypothetical protein [Candidatus Neomarinimicrobiota bacterium]MBT6391257.1 hypothetical protein [Candidatus Neomarinimicrobiota bacterium]MBT7113228.1 hypothetical protein [Candidatus Neomarinimicrobiota bacterium]
MSFINKTSLQIISFTTLFFILSCAGTKTSIPGFFVNPPSNTDFIYGVGNAKKQNISLARQTATARARSEIASVVQVKVSTMIKDFLQESGGGENAQVLEFTEYVSKQVSSVALSGCTIKESVIGDDGMFYVLVEYPLSSLRQEAIKEARKKEALFNEFKARQSFDDLENELNKLK